MRYYTVYQITNLVNNKIYVGVHQTDNLDDGYMSSSDSVAAAIKKYGRENFTKHILHHCPDESAMYAKEAEIVTESFIGRSDTYNIKLGGYGGWSHYQGTAQHKESCSRGGQARRDSMPVGKPFEKNSDRTKAISKKANETKKKLWEENPERRNNAVAKLSEYQTKNNSMSGKCWCVPIGSLSHNKDKKVFPIDNIPDGWIRVAENLDLRKRKSGTYGKYWIHHPEQKINAYHSGTEIPAGWVKGRKLKFG